MKTLWHKLSNCGITPYLNAEEKLTIVYTNRISVIVAIFAFTSLLINLLLGTYFFITILGIATLANILNLYFNKIHWFLVAKINLLVSTLVVLTYMLINGGEGSGLEFYYVSLIVLPAIIFQKKSYMFFFQGLCIAMLIFQRIYFNNHYFPPRDPEIAYKVFFIVNSIYSALLVVLGIYFFKNASLLQEQVLISRNKIISDKNKQLKQINKELTRTNSDLEQFIYVASHDLKEPLRMIGNFSELLSLRNQKDETSKEYSQYVLQAVFRMQHLINDLLSYSQIVNAENQIRAVDLNKVLKEIQLLLLPEIESKQALIEYKNLPTVYGIETHILQLFLNLISNALKFTDAHRQPIIQILCTENADECTFEVRDNGIGIESEYFEKIFVIFKRLHTVRDFPGTGIGLAIVKKIIENQGGKIWIKSKVGEGTSFYFTLKNGTLVADSE